jgi:cytochrome c oxidase subunit 2
MNRIPAALDTSRLRTLMTSGRPMTTPSSRTPRRALFTLLVVVTGALLLAPIASADILSPESGGSPNANDIDWLYKFVFAVALIVFLGVEGVLIYSVIKFKARKGAVAAQIRGNTRLEIGWTVGAAVVLVVLATLTFIKLDGIRNPPNSSPNGLQLADTSRRLPPSGKSLNICVNGQQYIWRYTYADDCRAGKNLGAPFSYEEMVVPVNTTVTLDIEAQDVIHSWWIPKLGGKFDAVPGYTNHTWFKVPGKFAAERGGTFFYGQCAELCGRGHANMTARVRAVSVQEYQAWLERRKADIASAEQQAAAQRQKLAGSAANSNPAGPAAPGQNPARPTDASSTQNP